MRSVIYALCAAHVVAGATFDVSQVAAIQKEFDAFSQGNAGRGIKLVIGNAKTGEQEVFQAGNAAKGKAVSSKTIYRLGGMTKIMAGMLTAIAFEEGVVQPSDPISKFVPELAASGLQAVDSQGSVTVKNPLSRDFTFWDCLGMKCGFSYAYWGMGTMREAADISPADGVLPSLTADKCAGAMTTANGGKLVREADWLACRKKHPLVSQPGERSYYGYDYDVIGLALSRAYKMDAETLMREKIWKKLGMDSAFMSWLPTGQSPKGDVADLFFKAPPASAYKSGSAPAGLTPGSDVWAKDVTSWDAEMWNLMGTFEPETSSDKTYPGVSGYGEGAMMTFEDFAKFLRVVLNKGATMDGKTRIVCETTWRKFTTPTADRGEGMRAHPAVGYLGQGTDFSKQSEWKWGYAGRRQGSVSTGGKPQYKHFSEASGATGEWQGVFGTMYKFDFDSGIFGVGGENTMPGLSGTDQVGAKFIVENFPRWASLLFRGDDVQPAPSPSVFDASVLSEIQKEFTDWSAKNGNRGVKLVVGSTKSGESQTLQAGNAAKGKAVSSKTIYRLGGMTKIMAGMLTAIAFEEGVVQPSDPISKFVPELAASGLQAVKGSGGMTMKNPLSRDFTFWDCLGMKCGFSYAYWGMGTMRETAGISPADGVLPSLTADKCAGAMTTANGGKLVREADWLACRKKHPLVSQPGERSYYGYDYDVIGLALSRAYKMDAETLMREKIWTKLGMDSAFMSWLPTGQSPKGDVADLFFKAPPASAYKSGSAPAGLTPGSDVWAKDVTSWDAEMWNLMGTFEPETSSDKTYPGVSGYGEGAMMTFEDFAKFLHAVSNKGIGANGKRVMRESTWSWFMTPTQEDGEGMNFLPAVGFSASAGDMSSQTLWKWGYASFTKEAVATATGSPSPSLLEQTRKRAGEWTGAFGTLYKFNADSGLYAVGGENTVLEQAGVSQPAADFINQNYDRWMARLAKGAHVKPPAPQSRASDAVKGAIQKEVDTWSKSFGDRGIKLVIGNAKTGEQEVFQAGNAAKGKAVSSKTIYRLGGMTKIMAGMLTAIAFEEGVVQPSDPISKFVPELAASGLQAVDSQGSVTVKNPLSRDFTFWDCLGMKCGFSYAYWGMGTMREAADISPADGVLPSLTADKCAGAMTTANGGKLVREADWLACRKKHPLVSQPGERSYYGYDYDVIGLALSRAYKMDAETLMREKIWKKLGMDSAFMSWLPTGQSPKGDVADLFFKAPPASAYKSGSAPAGLTPGSDVWAKDVTSWDAEMWNLMGTFEPETSSDKTYPGVSGYGEGAMMTFEDFAKFLSAFINSGNGLNSKVLGDTMARAMAGRTNERSEGLSMIPGLPYTNEGEMTENTVWKWGYANMAGEDCWSGQFGTVFRFNLETGDYIVGGENTLPQQAAVGHYAKDFLMRNANRWTSMLQCGTDNNYVAPNVTTFAPFTEIPGLVSPTAQPASSSSGEGSDGNGTDSGKETPVGGGGAAKSSHSGIDASALPILGIIAGVLALLACAGVAVFAATPDQRLKLADLAAVEDEPLAEMHESLPSTSSAKGPDQFSL